MTIDEIVVMMRGELTQGEFADQVGVSRQTVNEWECRKRAPSFGNVLRLLQVADNEQKEQLAQEYPLREIMMVLIEELGVRAK